MKRKKLSRRVNPEKSNKMIWAVGAGLVLLFAGLVFLLTWQPRPAGRRQLVEQTLAYLRGAEGFVAVQAEEDGRRVTLVYDGTFGRDFAPIARAAALRLASRLDDFELLLARNRAEQVEREFRVAGGRIVSERVAAAGQ